MSEERKLKKEINFLGLLAMSVGLNIGGALFALTNTAGSLTGPSLPLAMLISAVPILLALVPFRILTTAWPTTSGTYRYAQLLSPSLAYVCILTVGIALLIGGQPLYARAAGIFLGELVPLSPVLVGALVLTFFYVVNLLGIKLTARVQIALFFVLLSALVLFIVLGAPGVETSDFANPFPGGIGGLLAAAGILYTFCAGGLFVVDVGGETVNPEKNFPKALFWGICIVVVLTALIHIVTVGNFPWTAMEGTTLLEVAGGFMGPAALAYFIIAGALVACVTTINILFTIIGRSVMVVSQERLLPAFLGRVNARFGTPHWALTAAYLVSLTALLTIPSLLFFGSMLNLGLILAITVVTLSAAALPARYPALYRRAAVTMPVKRVKAVCYTVVALNSVIFLFLAAAVNYAALAFLGFVFVFYLVSVSRKGILDEIQRSRREGGVR